MLTETEKKEIFSEFFKYEKKSAACIEALKILQRREGWVSDEGIKSIADFLGLTPDEVDSVATFYNLIFRESVGKKVIFVCDSASCWIKGCGRILNYLTYHLGIRLGETTPDGGFTLLPIACLGACDHAPVLMINDDLYQDVDPEKMRNILNHRTE